MNLYWINIESKQQSLKDATNEEHKGSARLDCNENAICYKLM